MARMTVELPDDIVATIAKVAKEESVTKSEVIRRTFALLRVAQEEKEKGNNLGVVDADNKLVARLIGL